MPSSFNIPNSYYSTLANIESSNNPFAGAKTSSAKGLYQFTAPTWQGLGFNLSDIFNVNSQQDAIQKFTTQNASVLNNAGFNINDASLYAAHFLGPNTAVKVLGSDPSTALSNVLSGGVINANSFLKGMTVTDFKNWLQKKTGSSVDASGFANSVSKLSSKANNLANSAQLAVEAFSNPVAFAIKEGATAIAKKAEDATGISKLIAWLKDFFSANTAARFAAVIIGIILITVAVVSIILTSDTGKSAVKTAATLAA